MLTFSLAEFACEPELSPTSMYLTVPRGKNVSIVCTVSSDPVRYTKKFHKIWKIDFKTYFCNYLYKIFSYLYPIFFSILTSVIESKDRSRLSFSSFLYFSDVTWFFDGKRIDPPPEIVVEEPLTSNSFERVNNVSK